MYLNEDLLVKYVYRNRFENISHYTDLSSGTILIPFIRLLFHSS